MSVLLFANYFFYARWDLWYLAIIPLASTCDYFIGLGLAATPNRVLRRLLVTASIALNIGLIVFARNWKLSITLSFYAFQALTYTIDLYRRDAKATQSYLAHLAAVSFFPTILAGPITRVSVLLDQFEKRKPLAAADGGRALFLIGLGLIKKLMIADYLGGNLVNRVFDFPNLYTGAENLIAVYAYTLQLFYDFSGYTDIAIGSACCWGSSCRRISTVRTRRITSPISGGVGTLRSPTGCAITCTSRCPACARSGRFSPTPTC